MEPPIVPGRFKYTKDGRPYRTVVTRATSPSTIQLITTKTYDDARRLKKIEDDAGNSTTYTRDANGNVTGEAVFEKAQAGSSYDVTRNTDWTYDHRNLKLTEVRDPGTGKLNLTVTWKRDSRGNVVQQTDGRGNKQDMTYDGRDLLLTVTEDLIGSTRTTTTYAYDSNGNRTSITDDNSATTSFTYDALDRRTRRTNADSTYIEWTYDDDDAVTGWTDENGTVVANTLDNLGRVTHRAVTRATGVEGTTFEDFEYDALGRMTSAKDDDSVVTLKWDSLGRIHEESTGWDNTPTVTRTVKRDFDLTGNVTKLTYPDNTAIDYVIDADSSRIDQVKDGSNVVGDYRYVGYRVDQLDYLNGVVRSTSYDAAARVTEIDHVKSGTSRAKFTYSYDANDNVLYERRGHNASLYEVFTYDKRNELDTVWYDATTSSSPSVWSKKVEHAWDGAYNLDWTKTTLYGQAANTVNYTANSRNAYTTIGGSAPTWSANGELRDDNVVQTYNYDYRGRLTKVVRGSSTYTFKYDAFGRRIATNFGTELRFTWADDRILEEITSSTTPTVNARWVWGVDAEPLRMNRAGTLSYYHASRIGSVEKLTDTSGTSVETVEYEAFGKPSITSSGRGNTWLWRGMGHDYATVLYATGRPLDPVATMRFTTARGGSHYQQGRNRLLSNERVSPRSAPTVADLTATGPELSPAARGASMTLPGSLWPEQHLMDAGVPHDPSPDPGENGQWGPDGLFHCPNGCAVYDPEDCIEVCPLPHIPLPLLSCHDCMVRCLMFDVGSWVDTTSGPRTRLLECEIQCQENCREIGGSINQPGQSERGW